MNVKFKTQTWIQVEYICKFLSSNLNSSMDLVRSFVRFVHYVSPHNKCWSPHRSFVRFLHYVSPHKKCWSPHRPFIYSSISALGQSPQKMLVPPELYGLNLFVHRSFMHLVHIFDCFVHYVSPPKFVGPPLHIAAVSLQVAYFLNQNLKLNLDQNLKCPQSGRKYKCSHTPREVSLTKQRLGWGKVAVQCRTKCTNYKSDCWNILECSRKSC